MPHLLSFSRPLLIQQVCDDGSHFSPDDDGDIICPTMNRLLSRLDPTTLGRSGGSKNGNGACPLARSVHNGCGSRVVTRFFGNWRQQGFSNRLLLLGPDLISTKGLLKGLSQAHLKISLIVQPISIYLSFSIITPL
jgi:hypothetical protein